MLHLANDPASLPLQRFLLACLSAPVSYPAITPTDLVPGSVRFEVEVRVPGAGPLRPLVVARRGQVGDAAVRRIDEVILHEMYHVSPASRRCTARVPRPERGGGVPALAAGVARALAVKVAPASRDAAPGSVARYGGVPGCRFGGRPTASSASPGCRQARTCARSVWSAARNYAVRAVGDRHRARVVQGRRSIIGLTRIRNPDRLRQGGDEPDRSGSRGGRIRWRNLNAGEKMTHGYG